MSFDKKYERLKKTYDKLTASGKRKLMLAWKKKAYEYIEKAEPIIGKKEQVSQDELKTLFLKMNNHIDDGEIFPEIEIYASLLPLFKLRTYQLAKIYSENGGDGRILNNVKKYAKLKKSVKRFKKYVDHPVYGRLRY